MPLKALIIGIDYYKDANDLNFCINDANDWKDLLLNHFNTLDENITLLTKWKETKEKYILEKLREFVENLQPNDLGLFIFSGHGNINKHVINDKIVYEEQIRSCNGAISEEKIKPILNKLNSNAKLISIIDSCYSGGLDLIDVGYLPRYEKSTFLTPKTNMRHKVNKIDEPGDFVNPFTRNTYSNHFFISSCSSFELSFGDLINGRFNSVFTRYTINEIINNKNRSYLNILDQILTGLPDSDKGYEQTPKIIGDSTVLINQNIFST